MRERERRRMLVLTRDRVSCEPQPCLCGGSPLTSPHHRHGLVRLPKKLCSNEARRLARMTFCGFDVWCWKNVVIHFSNSRCQHRSTRLCKGHVVHRHHSTSTCNHILELEKSLDCVSSLSHHRYLPRIMLWLMWVTGLHRSLLVIIPGRMFTVLRCYGH